MVREELSAEQQKKRARGKGPAQTSKKYIRFGLSAVKGVGEGAVVSIVEARTKGGRFTGRPRGTPSFREGKIHCVREWLAGRGERLEDFESWFYSDSLNDLPLLELVDHPVAVDPDATLRARALERGWPVISLKP